MAASAASAGSPPGLCPSYAVICSFLERYGALLDLPELTFPQLERYLQDTSSVPKLLVDLHVKLLRKVGKSVSADRWEKYLVKICHEFNSTWAWELENKGYKDMSVESKTGILKHLCESQFDDNIKFKTAINEEDPEQMRLQPIGKDKDGLMYWFQLDQDNNVRVYVEEQDDLDGSSWKCIVRDRNSLAEILALLKTQIDPALLTKKGEENEEGKKTEGEVKKTEDSSEDEEDKPSKDKVLLDSPKSEITERNSQQEELKLDVSDVKCPLNGLKDNKAESTIQSEMPMVDDNVTIDTQAIKEEPEYVSESKLLAENSRVMPPTEQTEEAKRKTAEELQRAKKNDQQAKIPLKKREMKHSEDFDINSGSSIVMRTGSVTPVEEGPKVEEKIKVVSVALEGQMKETTIDQVNGDLQPASEKSVNGLRESAKRTGTQRDSAYGKEQQTTDAVGGKNKATESIAKEKTNLTLDKDNEKHELATNTEEPVEVATAESNVMKMVPSTMAEKKINEVHEEGKESAFKKVRPLSPPTTKPLTSSKATISPMETSNRKEEQHVKKEPVDIRLESSTDDNVKINEYADKVLPKMSLQSGETEIKPTKALVATSKTVSVLTDIEVVKKRSQDRVTKEDVTQKGDARSDDQATREKVDDQTKKDDKKVKEMLEKDVNIMEEEVEKEKKVCEESEKEKPKNKKDEDKTEKQDAVTTSEIQEEGIRLKIRGITHRRKAELQREERDSGSDTGEMGRSLRRSPRICRPTPKGVEFQDRRLEKKQNTPTVEKVDEEKKEEEEETTVQRKPREKIDNDGQSKSKGRRRRKTRWSNSRMRRHKKNGSGEDDESESSEEESEEDDSDESFKVEGGKRKRRNRDRVRHTDDSDTSSDDDLPPNDDPCKHCGLPNHPELILLCDSCDNGYHTACLRPPLMVIPDGEWFCPPCQHKLLCDKLEEQLTNLDAALKKRERAERRKERLVYVGISVENIITPSLEIEDEKEEEVVKKEKKEKEKSKSWGRRSTRAKKSISYRFDEFDEAIEEAIEEDIREADGGGAGRGKDMANITGHSRGKDMATILAAGEAAEGKENGLPSRPTAGQRRKKRRRLNDLDSDSTMDDEESEDEFRLSDSTEEEEFVASDKSDVESEAAGDSNDDSDVGSARRRTAKTRRLAKRLKSTRKRRKPRGYSDDDDEEETSEEDEDEIVSEGTSDFSDSDLDCSRRRSRRSQTKKQVNYCESSGDSDGSKAATNRDKVKLRRRLDSSDSEASLSRASDGGERLKRRDDSSEAESRQRRRRLSLKRRRASEEDDDDYDSDESSEGERPVRKRVNRIASDDSDEDEKAEAKEDEEVAVLGKGVSPLDYSLVELHPPTNGQSPIKALESLAHIGPQKPGATPVAIAPNGLEVASQDDDEDDLLGVTDLVDFVCNSDVL
ncbi:hypothetical protein UPYG_G00125200 [Umbra pygmaea]|uniref:Remodeling and spacing factor 1 n=1 Tax=Umbra pygmaea TaxID=75934 RepID=A0ABD0X5V6_UMBPY